jgi:hypothetical protein
VALGAVPLIAATRTRRTKPARRPAIKGRQAARPASSDRRPATDV